MRPKSPGAGQRVSAPHLTGLSVAVSDRGGYSATPPRRWTTSVDGTAASQAGASTLTATCCGAVGSVLHRGAPRQPLAADEYPLASRAGWL